MTTSPEIEAGLELARELIKDYESVLSRRGYQYEKSEVRTSRITADSVDFFFRNDVTGGRIDISYTPASGNYPQFLNALITNSRGQHFTLGSWLQAHKRQDTIKRLIDVARTGDVRGYWDHFFALLDHLFDTDLKDIIEGRRWEEVPIDWQGLK
jgi:hypothetical protein